MRYHACQDSYEQSIEVIQMQHLLSVTDIGRVTGHSILYHTSSFNQKIQKSFYICIYISIHIYILININISISINIYIYIYIYIRFFI